MGFESDDRKQKMWRTNVRRLAGCMENRTSRVCYDTKKWEACFVVICLEFGVVNECSSMRTRSTHGVGCVRHTQSVH